MSINLFSPKHSLHHQKVEWDLVSKIIAQFAYFEANKTALTAEPLASPEAIETELARTADYLKQVKDEQRQIILQLLHRLPSDHALARHLSHLAKEGILGFPELNRLIMMAEAAVFCKKELAELTLPEFGQIGAQDFLPLQRQALREFRHLVDESGQVHFDRHPELSEITKRLRELEERLRRTIQDWLNEPSRNKLLQFQSYDVHYDRYVVPIRSDSYRAELGLIVSRSESGQTLFVEPHEVRDTCNRRMELIAKIDEIVNQLAQRFSRQLHPFVPLLQLIHENLLAVDHYLAKSAFAFQYQLSRPLIRQAPGFKMEQLFHPLISGAVKNDVNCGNHHHGIVISGPNTGGKTVFLKSVALCYLLFSRGFFVPAREAELYPYQGLFYFGNDLQDLSAGLSSFSGEVKDYIELIEHILASNLILIDEIFNSTSSDEASALSLAYFQELHQRAKCHIVVSTHHQMFKTLVHQDRHYLSCHVGFDTTEMRPTYKIQWGTPGSSMAIDIFRILAQGHALVKDVPANALTRLNSKSISYETLLQKVSQKQIELDKLIVENRQLEVELRNQKGAMEGILNLRLQEEMARARKEMDRILNEARQTLEQARRQEIQKIRKVDERAFELQQQLKQLAPNEPTVPAPDRGDLAIDQVAPGDTVFSMPLRKEFIVTAVDQRRKEITISKGPIKLTVPITTLSRSRQAPKSPQVHVTIQKNSAAKFEYDVRGMRLSEFQALIENALGDLLAGDVPYITVIHGHGDGVLKNWLREYLKRSKDFMGAIPENGNDGETKISLK
jgi:DNA mismatch repair protein MutS2